MNLKDRLESKGPKRILALDGGGIRGALTLGYLERVESLLRERHGRPEMKLADYFDLIGGTSTGSIIAGALAIGLSVADVKEKYLELGGKVFSKNRWWRLARASFDATQLRGELRRLFGDITLGGAEVRTGLCVITKRADTNSTWPFINHPAGTYYKHNEGLLLRRVIRASTAAPTYFEAENLDVGFGEPAAFVDGGVSMANNPALQLFLAATLKGFPFRWPTGEHNLLVVSVGTGTWKLRKGVDAVMGHRLWDWAKGVPSMLMYDANWQNQLMLQYMSRTHTSWVINTEVGDLADDLLSGEPLLSYLRYDTWLDENGLQKLGLPELVERVDSLRDMSAGKNRHDLLKVGEAAAKVDVLDKHFPRQFDLK